MPLPAFDDDWLMGTDYRQWLVGMGLSDSTIRNYELRIRQATDLLAEQGVDLDTALPTHIRFVSESLPRGSSTQRQLSSALKHYYAMIDRDRPPYRAVRVPPKPQPKNKALSVEDARLLAKAAKSWHPQGTAVMLGLYMALRAAEIASFTYAMITGDMEWYTVFGKGSRTHTLPVHPVLIEELGVIRRFVPGDFLFPGARGRKHVTTQTIWNWVREVSQEAGIGDVHPHQLRHTALTTANDNSSDLRAVSQFARHQRIETTTIYTRTSDDQLKRVMMAIDYG